MLWRCGMRHVVRCSAFNCQTKCEFKALFYFRVSIWEQWIIIIWRMLIISLVIIIILRISLEMSMKSESGEWYSNIQQETDLEPVTGEEGDTSYNQDLFSHQAFTSCLLPYLSLQKWWFVGNCQEVLLFSPLDCTCTHNEINDNLTNILIEVISEGIIHN